MKRKLLLVLVSVLLLCLPFAFTSCGDDTAKEVSALTIVEGTLATEYTVGDRVDFSGVKAVVTYSDGTAETVGSDKLTISTLDTSSEGKKTVSIKFGKFETKVEITVKAATNEPVVTAIKIVEASFKSIAFVGDTYDASQIQIEATYSDGTVMILGYSDVEVILPDTTEAGEKLLAVKYGSLTDAVTVTVSAVTAIKVVEGSIKNEVFVGEEFDTSSLSVIVSYTNAPDAIVSADKLEIGTIDTTAAGVQVLTITYNGFVAEYKVTVLGVASVSVNTASVPSKVKFMSELDLSGITATVTFTNGKAQTVGAEELTLSKINTSSAGVKTLTVSYKGVETTVDITVIGVKSLTVITGTLKSEVLVGETVNTDAIEVSVVYTDDSTEIIGKDKLNLGTVDTETAGEKNLSITYLDGAINFPVKVCAVESIRIDGVSKVVSAGEKPDLTNMKVYAVYGDTQKTEVLITDGYTTNIDSLDFNVEGDKTFKVTWGELEASLVISTTEPELVRIEIRTYNAVVGLGRAYDKSSVTVMAYYGNNTSHTVSTDIVISELSTAVAGDVTLEVSYTENGITQKATATVKVLPITAMTVSGLADTVELGNELSTESLKLTVTYSDGTNTLSAVVYANEGIEVKGFDKNTAGDQTLTVSYLGTTVEHKLHVRGVSSIKILAGTLECCKIRLRYRH